jgi:RNA polymerase sigma factor (sigma-70 family)
MIRGKGVRRPIEVLWSTGTMSGLTDAHLLRRFTHSRDSVSEMAFGELVHRHGPMVWGVCRQILRHSADADDAFQATFLALVSKAGSIRVQDSLAPWLYGVAFRTAHRARATAARYRSGNETQFEAVEASVEDACKLDLRPLLYEELSRLPDKLRAPIVLCHLEGKSHQEAAQLLSWPVGTLSGRLSRARQLLRSRLERRGLAVPAAIFSAAWLSSQSSASATVLLDATVKAALRFPAAHAASAIVLSLTQGVLRAMAIRKLATISAAVLLLGTISGGAVVWAHRPSAPSRQLTQDRNSAPVSTQQKDASPAATPNSTPDARPEPRAGGSSVLAQDGSTDCPITGADCPLSGCDDSRTNCPISMAANAFSRIFAQLHGKADSAK